jgi:8-amino-7-oxononanoate synthase
MLIGTSLYLTTIPKSFAKLSLFFNFETWEYNRQMPQILNIDSLPNRTIHFGDASLLFFSGTSYLGMSQNEEIRQFLTAAQSRYGSVYGSSRNGNVQLEVYEKAEQKLADFTGAPAALTLSSGMLAGQSVVQLLVAQGYDFIYSPDVHPALWHQPTIQMPVLSFNEWVQQLPQIIENKVITESKKIAIVTNSVNAMQGYRYDFGWLNDLTANVTVVIDDSHGLGVIGTDGQGIWSDIPIRNNIKTIVTASLAKALGLAGGVVFADELLLNDLRATPYFSGCSPMAPYQLAAYLQADGIYTKAHQRLQANVALFIDLTQHLHLFENTESYPVFYTTHNALYEYLLARHVLIYSYAYPIITQKPTTRIIISAWHTATDIEYLADCCAGFNITMK